MSRPELTPGNGGGGKPTKPESDNVWQFPWLVSQPELNPEPDVTSVTPMINLVPPLPPAPEPNPFPTIPPGLHVPPPPTVQQPRPASSDPYVDSAMQEYNDRQERRLGINSVVPDREPPLDIPEIKLGLDAEDYVFPIHPVDMAYHIAAQHNPLLKEIRSIIEHEGIPVALQGNYEACLRLCGDYGIDEENDAEARDYLAHIMNGSSSHQNTDDPLNATWQETLTAYEMFKANTGNDVAEAAYKSELKAYKTLVENIYGVEFTHVEGRTSWDLLGIRMAHVAFEQMARALSIAVRDYFKLDWDDATAFRRVIGKIEIHNSIDPIPRHADGTIKGIAQVDGDRIKVYWNEKEGRNAYLMPNAMLHELGHILNANGAFGVNQFKAWFNFLEDYPKSRKGMGAPADDVLIGKTVIYSYQPGIILPTLAQDIGIWDPDHVIFDQLRDDFPTQVQSLQQSTEKTNNEKTADAILNWVKFLITGGRFGFTSDEEGLNWQRVMNEHMDEVIRNAIAHNMMPKDGQIDVSHLGGYPKIYGLATVRARDGLNSRSTPVLKGQENVVTVLKDGQRIAVLGISEDKQWIASERYGVLVWVSRGTRDNPLLMLPEDLKIEDLPVLRAHETLDLDP